MGHARVMSRSLRRLASIGLVAALSCVALVGCGSTGEPAGGGEAAAEGEAASAGSAFPVTITHSKGEVTIPAKPERVVALGYTDIAVASALGANIVGAVRNAYGSDGINFPFVEPPLSAEVASLDLVEPNIEQIAALRPDLILATTTQLGYDKIYDQLSGIAPTLSYKTELLQDSPKELTRMIGTALGERQAAKDLIADADAAVETFVTEHPDLQGATYVFGQVTEGGVRVITGADARSSKFFARLGLTPPEAMAERGTGIMGSLELSWEQLQQLDQADIAFIVTYGDESSERFRSSDLVAQLRLQQEGHLHEMEVDLANAVLEPNPANIQPMIEAITPWLEGLEG